MQPSLLLTVEYVNGLCWWIERRRCPAFSIASFNPEMNTAANLQARMNVKLFAYVCMCTEMPWGDVEV